MSANALTVAKPGARTPVVYASSADDFGTITILRAFVRSAAALDEEIAPMRTSIFVPCCCFIALIACSSHTEAPRKAAADLEGSAAAGMSYNDFGHKLQELGSAISLARRDGASARALRPYQDAFDIYMDGMELWKLTIDCPAEFMKTGTDCSIVESKMEEFASKYGVPYEGSNLHRAWLDKNANVPFGSREQYPTWDVRQANRNVFPKL